MFGSREERWASSPRVTAIVAVVANLFAFSPVSSQVAGPTSIYARVRDQDGAALFAVTARLRSGDSAIQVAESDRLGFFGFEGIPPGSYRLELTRLGYEPDELELSLGVGEEVTLDFSLEPAPVAIEGVQAEAERSRGRGRFEETAGATVREISIEQIRNVPGVLEPDPIRAIEVLPGVVSTSDLSATFHVRGGSSDQNLILLDGVPVFSPFHLGGFFSVFNPDMLDRVELHSGGFPAEHGGRVSSVLTVETDPGDGEFGVEGGASLLSTRVAVSGGFSEGLRERLGLSSVRWRGSARRSYFDVLFKPFFNFPYHLTDLQGAFEGWTAGGDRIELTGYHGRDVLDLRDLRSNFPLRLRWDWGNDVAGASWTRPLQRGGSVAVDASFSRFGSGLAFSDFGDTDIRTEIEQLSLGAGLDLPLSSRARLKLGIDADRLSYDNLFVSGGTEFEGGRGTGWLLAGYGELDLHLGEWLLESGVRLGRLAPGPGAADHRYLPQDRYQAVLPGWAMGGEVSRRSLYAVPPFHSRRRATHWTRYLGAHRVTSPPRPVRPNADRRRGIA